jgi:hypothetical protein
MTSPRAAAETALEGGCTCRAVRFRLLGPPLFVHCCHCTWCQRESGAAFALNAMIESSGSSRWTAIRSSSRRRRRAAPASGIARCRRCRVAVWSHYAGAGDAIRFVRVGTLDEPGRLPPDIHIFTASKQPWVVLPPDVRRCPSTTTQAILAAREPGRREAMRASAARAAAS